MRGCHSRQRPPARTMWALAAALTAATLQMAASTDRLDTQLALGKALVHTVITSGCSKYFDWQVMGLVYS